MTFIKICGLKNPETAKFCADLGVSAIGCVFYKKSPRHVSVETARTITRNVPETLLRVAVMVNPSVDEALAIAQSAGCNAIQLHGNESPETAFSLMKNGLQVIKAFYVEGLPSIASAKAFSGAISLVEAASGKLPGGNAATWDWSSARRFSKTSSLILAGGLSPENILQALEDARPWGVDVSSGVESAPGIKDIEKIRHFIETVQQFDLEKKEASP
ncbi:phosphoribosylanthranilate isomerase [Desulfosarcina sp. OttesenSCG-928-A07]|nr:phosphoribosylanthranilate isomerase [Desulfosarcina sp. OttesenSCG-928-A07]